MKHYDRETGRYLTEEERRTKLKKRSKCKGGREHDWVRVLPYGVSANSDYRGDVEPYYAAEEAIANFIDKQYEELAKIGILVQSRGWRGYRNGREERCSVCGKHKYISI